MYYVELDKETGLYCVFDRERAKESYSSRYEAMERMRELNQHINKTIVRKTKESK